ncbi:protein fem-1 homolog B [Harpegnathos saltator]|uniref:Protein fem-1-like protein B n=1 Tax=Harpegnathos saltator TaxID=610380 RepID=E2B9W3_HARSA|nr:protein fem-1 homolog B [Harpegnathos saltator]EFN87550.1 Protein fem-1-like protein B [Harpegnathos saltator]
MDIVSEIIDEFQKSLAKRIYYSARDGMAIALYTLLNDRSNADINRLINQKFLEDDGQRCTVLIIAARYGHDKVVKMLLDKFKPDLEQEGTVKFDGYVIEGASALWAAAGAGHLNVVKTLVKAGANVNHPTKTNSTPLRAACFDGRLDIVKYLTDHQADISISNKFNNTCLMIAAYKGHLDVVNFLLDKGADPNQKALCGATALHFAAECGHTMIVRELLRYGTKMTKNVSGMTPLIAAAERTRAQVVECLVKREEVTKEEIIDAYELLGASYANDKDSYCLIKAYKYLHKAMELRYSDTNNIVYKKLGLTVKAYENWKECETLEQLENIKNNANAIHMESLAIRERILGLHNPELTHPIVFRGAIFADNARFDRCIDLWLHALKLRQLNNITVVTDLLRFAQVFSQMIHVGVDLDISQVINVLEASITELSKNKAKMQNPDLKDDAEQYVEELESNTTTTLYILTILTKLMTLNGNRCNESDLTKAHHLVHKLCALRICLKDGQTLLHLAVNAETPVDDFHTNDVCKFPCAATAKLLIRCGADVNAMDNERNTPLHIIVGYSKSISDFSTLHSIIMELIEAGAHMDTVNNRGHTPYDAVTTGVAEIILRSQTKLSLMCMAAKAVKAYNLSYTGNVPRCLETFIELHGPGLNQG